MDYESLWNPINYDVASKKNLGEKFGFMLLPVELILLVFEALPDSGKWNLACTSKFLLETFQNYGYFKTIPIYYSKYQLAIKYGADPGLKKSTNIIFDSDSIEIYDEDVDTSESNVRPIATIRSNQLPYLNFLYYKPWGAILDDYKKNRKSEHCYIVMEGNTESQVK